MYIHDICIMYVNEQICSLSQVKFLYLFCQVSTIPHNIMYIPHCPLLRNYTIGAHALQLLCTHLCSNEFPFYVVLSKCSFIHTVTALAQAIF